MCVAHPEKGFEINLRISAGAGTQIFILIDRAVRNLWLNKV